MTKEETKKKTKEDYYLILRDAMDERGVYDTSLDPAVKILAGLMVTYDDLQGETESGLILNEYSREGNVRHVTNPAFQLIQSVTEQIRKYMRDLGLVVAKPAGFVSTEKDNTRPGDSLKAMIETLNAPQPKKYSK